MKARSLSLNAVYSDVRRSLGESDFEAALQAIRHFTELVIADPGTIGRVFASRELDALCLEIGAHFFRNEKIILPQNFRKETVIVATEFVRIGGHGAVAKDIIRLGLFGGDYHVLLTDLWDRADILVNEELASLGAAVELAPRVGIADRLRWLVRRLNDLSPKLVLLMNHHQDSIAVAAMLPGIAEKVFYIHHGDHHLCLGVTVPHFVHVDLTNIGFFNCRDHLGIEANLYWPLTASRSKLSQHGNFLADGKLRTCSSGSPHKFDADAYNYQYHYTELLPRLIQATGGCHLHLGEMPAKMEGRIRQELEKLAISQERFTYLRWVPSIAEALNEHNIDLYISSFPFGGGKATIEAMSAGIPLLMHENYVSRFHGGADLAYPQAWIWRNASELINIVCQIDADQLARHAHFSREHYERFHTDSALRKTAICATADLALVPPRREYRGNALRAYLDLTDARIAETTTELNSLRSEIDSLHSERDELKKSLLSSKVHEFCRSIAEIGARLIPSIVLSSNQRNLRLIRSSGYFDRKWYLAHSRDVARAKIDPAQHYLDHGGFEGRDPGPHFSTTGYLRQNPDVAAARINPLLHFVLYSVTEGRRGGVVSKDIADA